jgi:hypothetical protein
MIICLEGASAVGKTTTCAAVADREKAFFVGEVNALFKRPEKETPEWYLEQQVKRVAIASELLATHSFGMLDGDPFQPLWYNWTFSGYQPLSVVCDFFRPQLADGHMKFPDRYLVLTANEVELKRRKESDTTRTRRGFESHLKLIEVHRRYFEMMCRFAPGTVHFIEATSVDECVEAVVQCSKGPASIVDQLELFDGLVDWLNSNVP